jgi:methyl-accepting chemotaxis protein
VQVGFVVWRENPGAQPDLLHASAAPVRDAEGRFLGSILLGYFVANSEAAELQQTIGSTRVGYFVAAGADSVAVRGESSGAPSDYLSRISGAALTSAVEGAAADETIGFGSALTERPSQLYGLSLGDETLRLLPHRFAAVDGEEGVSAGFFAITSVSRYVAPVAAIGSALGVAAVVAIIVGLLLLAFALRGFMAPIEDVSRGVQEVIAGNREYIWPVDEKSYLSDLSHSLNVMSARLQGKVDPDADEASESWSGGDAKPAVASLGGLRGKKAREGDGEST